MSSEKQEICYNTRSTSTFSRFVCTNGWSSCLFVELSRSKIRTIYQIDRVHNPAKRRKSTQPRCIHWLCFCVYVHGLDRDQLFLCSRYFCFSHGREALLMESCKCLAWSIKEMIRSSTFTRRKVSAAANCNQERNMARVSVVGSSKKLRDVIMWQEKNKQTQYPPWLFSIRTPCVG